MSYRIGLTDAEDLPSLGRFLAEGFESTSEADFVTPEVLQWKYLAGSAQPLKEQPRSLLARDEAGQVVGHVGLRHTRWRLIGSSWEVATLHMIDWLGSPSHRGVGLSLLRAANRLAKTQYVLGGSAIARRICLRAGYRPLDPVPVFRRVLRPGYRLRDWATPRLRRLPLAIRDTLRLLGDRPRRLTGSTQVVPVKAFGSEVEAIMARCPAPLLFTGRTAGDLNEFLSYPRADPSGWLVKSGSLVIGFALLNVVSQGRNRIGKVVDLFLDCRDPFIWAETFAALAFVLKERGADVALALGAPSWESDGLRAAGFQHAFDLDLILRDPDGLVPLDVDRHLGFLEGDYAFIP